MTNDSHRDLTPIGGQPRFEGTERDWEVVREGHVSLLLRRLEAKDRSNAEKSGDSEQLLREFVSEVSVGGTLSPLLIAWMARSISDYLNRRPGGAIQSLDDAFHLHRARGRPTAVPDWQAERLRAAFLAGRGALPWPNNEVDGHRAAEIGITAAYRERYGRFPADDTVDEATIQDRLTEMRKLIREYGLYIDDPGRRKKTRSSQAE